MRGGKVRVREYHCESARVSVRDVGDRFCVKATGRLTLRTGSAGSPQQQQATCSGTEGGLKRSLADWPCARPACMCPFRVYKSQNERAFSRPVHPGRPKGRRPERPKGRRPIGQASYRAGILRRTCVPSYAPCPPSESWFEAGPW